MLLVSSRDDGEGPQGNAGMNETLASLVPKGVRKELIIFEKGGHGTALLTSEGGEGLIAKILDFIK